MPKGKTYKDKLQDPRWQKKRLLILQRDNWSCILCGDAKSTLHVHHKKYTGQPWEASDNDLMTLCGECHFLTEYYKPHTVFKVLKEPGDGKVFFSVFIEKNGCLLVELFVRRNNIFKWVVTIKEGTVLKYVETLERIREDKELFVIA